MPLDYVAGSDPTLYNGKTRDQWRQAGQDAAAASARQQAESAKANNLVMGPDGNYYGANVKTNERFGASKATAAPAPAAASGGGGGGEQSPTQQAMQGLQAVVEQAGPTVGWADDPALAQTAEGLGTAIPKQAMNALSQQVRGVY